MRYTRFQLDYYARSDSKYKREFRIASICLRSLLYTSRFKLEKYSGNLRCTTSLVIETRKNTNKHEKKCNSAIRWDDASLKVHEAVRYRSCDKNRTGGWFPMQSGSSSCKSEEWISALKKAKSNASHSVTHDYASLVIYISSGWLIDAGVATNSKCKPVLAYVLWQIVLSRSNDYIYYSFFYIINLSYLYCCFVAQVFI